MASEAVKASPAAAQIADEARLRFDQACPGAKDACDMIEHFAEYALGTGNRQPGGNLRPTARPTDRLPAAQDWPLRYDPPSGHILLGPVAIDIAVVCDQAKNLARAIWASVRTFEDATPGGGLATRPS